MIDSSKDVTERMGTFGPLRQPLFRRIWTASLFSNFGQLIQAVGAAWAMTELTGRADMVALVQSATFAPLMFFSLAAGAIADSYDRRKIALVALIIALSGALGLTLVTLFDLLTPGLLLLFCAVVGTGTALFSPAWQASVGEQVPPKALPQAIALNAMSYNIARSFGPALGGVLVAVAGVISAFAFNVIAYLPNILVMFLWRRAPEKTRLPPEALGRAIISGVRYVFHSPPIRAVWLRTLLLGLIGSAVSALMPLISRQLLSGDASLYGILLGCYGGGAVVGGLCISRVRDAVSDEKAMSCSIALAGISLVGVGFSAWAPLTCLLLMLVGGSWTIVMSLCNISIQMSAPRWVTGRALAAFTTAICAGMTLGGWFWGQIAEARGTGFAMVTCGVGLILSILLGFVLRMPEIEDQSAHDRPLTDPDTRLDIRGRSGPIILSIAYRVPADQARAFYAAMLDLEAIRNRTGAYGWSLARDIGDPELWVERYHTPTWHDYLRQRARLTAIDMAVWERATAFHKGDEPVRVQRLLERPYGSVRRSDEIPDRGIIVPLPTQGG